MPFLKEVHNRLKLHGSPGHDFLETILRKLFGDGED